MRWVHYYVPEFERRWNRFARPVGPSSRVDETHVKIRGKWVYLYRTVDREARTVDFRLSSKRDVAAAKAFFRKAIKGQGSTLGTITLDGYAASHRAVREMKADDQIPTDTKPRSSKYLNTLVSGSRKQNFVKAQFARSIFTNRCWGGFELVVALTADLAASARPGTAARRGSRSSIIAKRLGLAPFYLQIAAGPFGRNILESAEFSATFWRHVMCAHSRRATVR